MENSKFAFIKEHGVCLVLSGGGFRGAFHVGVLAFLDEHGITVHEISGTSIGALVGCSYASGVKPATILDIMQSREFQGMVRFNYSLVSLFKIQLSDKVLKKLFLVDTLEALKIPTHIAYTSLSDANIIYKNEGLVIPSILKSISLFPIFESIKENDKIYVDGGVFDNLPLSALKQREHILSVNLHPNTDNVKDTMFSKIKQILRLVWYASIKESVEQSDSYITNKKLSNYSIISQKNNLELFHLGYESCKNYFSEAL